MDLEENIKSLELNILANQELNQNLNENLIEWQNANQLIEQQIVLLQEQNQKLTFSSSPQRKYIAKNT